MNPLDPLRIVKSGLLLSIIAQPQAKVTEVVGQHGGALKIKVHATPEDGKANAEIIRFLSELFEIPKAKIRIQSGLTSRKKLIALEGISHKDASAKLGLNK